MDAAEQKLESLQEAGGEHAFCSGSRAASSGACDHQRGAGWLSGRMVRVSGDLFLVAVESNV